MNFLTDVFVVGYSQRHAATPNPDRERTVPLSAGPAAANSNSSGPAASNSNPGGGSLVKTSPPTILSDLDPDTIPREFKKEGAEWFALWNPRNKKTLDVNLVHTLVHERCVGACPTLFVLVERQLLICHIVAL